MNNRGRTAAGAVWILFILGPFTGGLTALAGWIVTVAARGGADSLPREHMRRQGRLFWTAVLVGLLIDELRAGKIGRREFIRRGATVGMSVPLLGFIASACGVSKEDLELFWTAVLIGLPIAVLGFIGWLTRIVLIGYPIGWAAAALGFLLGAWFVINSLIGLFRLQGDRPPRG